METRRKADLENQTKQMKKIEVPVQRFGEVTYKPYQLAASSINLNHRRELIETRTEEISCKYENQ